MHFNPSTSLLKIVIEMIYIDVQMCIYSMQGFSLFKVVLLCDVTSNTMLFLLKSKGTAIYYICFSKPKRVKGVWMVSGACLKATFKKKKWQHQNFCSWSQNWFYATFSPPFLDFWFTSFHWSSSGGMGRMHLSWSFFFFWKGASPQQCPHPVIVFPQPVVVLQKKGPLSCEWNETALTERKATTGLLVHVWARLSVCCSVAQRHQLVYEI